MKQSLVAWSRIDVTTINFEYSQFFVPDIHTSKNGMGGGFKV
ncbi:MAG: hypothetical protein JWP77_304 [Polaromonas sp.]|jgi:hypothetical protein|nr:hypothetical protein [Polaromonas sp.]